MLSLGQKVKILECYNVRRINQTGIVVEVTLAPKPGSARDGGHRPASETEWRYIVEFDDGGRINNMREGQLQKV